MLVYGYRHKPFGIRARVLDAECTNAATAKEIVLRDDGGNGDLGYPWATMVSPDRVLVTYYFNKADGMRHIARAQVAQTQADRWIIRIVPQPGYTERDGERVLAKLASHVSPRVHANIELVDALPSQDNGKYKWVSQEFSGAVRSPPPPHLSEIAC